MDDHLQLRERVAKACRIMGLMGLAKGVTGHASARIPGTDRVLVRARGPNELGVRFTTAEQIVEITLDGKLASPNDQGLKAPKEVYIHTSVYKARPDVYGVVHAHPMNAVLFTICRKPLRPLFGAYDPDAAKLAINPLPVYPYSILCDTPERGDELAEALGRDKGCLMTGHGITTCGPNVEEATMTAIALEELALVNYRAAILGEPVDIPIDEQDFIEAIDSDLQQAGSGAPPAGRAISQWRYYCMLEETARR